MAKNMQEATAQHLQAVRGEWVGVGEGEEEAPGDESCFRVKAVMWEPTETCVAPLPPTCPNPRFQ